MGESDHKSHRNCSHYFCLTGEFQFHQYVELTLYLVRYKLKYIGFYLVLPPLKKLVTSIFDTIKTHEKLTIQYHCVQKYMFDIDIQFFCPKLD